jgi:tRNA-dihydrouridine synthase
MKIPVFGNGDVDTPQKALEYRNQFGVDGIMIGRASIGYPWIFNEVKHFMKTGEILPPPTVFDRVEVAKQHLEMSVRWKGESLGIAEMKRHYSNYFKGIAHIKEYRMKLVTSFNLNEIMETLNYIQDHSEEFQLTT